jgi:hypothetical protein
MTIKIEIVGTDYADCMKQLGVKLSTEEAVGIFGQFIGIDNDAGEAVEAPEAPEEAPKKRGRPPKAAPEVETKAVEKAAEPKAVEKVAEPKVNGARPLPTKEDIIIALNNYAESHGGQSAGRDVMKQVCGVTRLVDCAVTDYPKLLEALGA